MSLFIKYKLLTNEIFRNTIIKEKASTILVFGAEWSGNAEIMDSMVERISREFSLNLLFFKVDIEKQTDIALFFGVVQVPTIVMLKDGEVIEFIKGFISASKLRNKIKLHYPTNKN